MTRSTNWFQIALATALFFGQGVAQCVCAPEEHSHEHHSPNGVASGGTATLSRAPSEPVVVVHDSERDSAQEDSCCCISPSDNAVPPCAATASAAPFLPSFIAATLSGPPVIVLPLETFLPGIYGQDSGPPGESPPSSCLGRAPPVA